MICIVCGKPLTDDAAICVECGEDMGIDLEEWKEDDFRPLSPHEQIDAMADLLAKKNRGEL